MMSWLTRAARLACAGALIAATARAQDLPITRWLVRGPIPTDTGASRLTRDYLGGETTVLPDSGDVIAGGAFVPVDADSLGGVDLLKVFAGGTDHAAAYAHAYVYAPEDRTVLLVMDSDDDLVAWLNGQRVWFNDVARGLRSGSDTVPVRLAAGWNSLLLKPVNRTGGFGVLGRLARAPGEPPLEGIRTAYRRPSGLAATHVYPASTITASALRLAGAATWNRDRLELPVSLALTAWGRDSLAGVIARVTQPGASWASDTVTALAPANAQVLRFQTTFDELRRAALDVAPLTATVTWPGGTRNATLAVDADWLLRVWGSRLAVGSWLRDSSADGTRHLQTTLIVPSAFDGRSLDLLSAQFGPRAQYAVNGHAGAWREGTVELCAPCHTGDTLGVAIRLEPGRPWWTLPEVRVRDLGYKEFADGYGYALRLAGHAPAMDRPDPREWLAAIGGGTAYGHLLDRYATAYAPLAAELRRDTLHLIGNSHIDAAWLWPWSETEGEVIPNTWRTSLKLAAMFPGYVFAASAAAYYDAVDRLYPGLADSLRAAVRAGQWNIVGGWWLEPDQNIPSGEDLARQGLYGQRYFEHRYGRRAKVGWTPDSFGYPWTLPQIYKLAGLDYFVTQKIRWNDSTQLPYDAFWWEGRDGTRLFTYNPFGYDHDLEPDRLISDRLDDERRNNGIHHQLVLYGVGDHGGGPTIAMLQRAEELRRVPTFPTMMYDNADHALADVRASQPDSVFPVWHDELYLEYHRGTYTTQARQKWSARHSDALLRTAEALAAVDTAAYPRARLEGAWRRILFNEFHDILPGSGIHINYIVADQWYDSSWATLDTVTSRALDDLSARLDTRGAGGRAVPVVVFNALTWPRSGLVRVPLPGGDTATFLASDVPSLGARVFTPRAGTVIASRLPAPTVGPNWLENAYLRVEVDTTTGEITRLYDRRHRREVLAPGGRANVLQVLYDLPQDYDAWNTGFNGQQWEVTETSGVGRHADGAEASIRFARHWGRSTFTQTLTLGRETPYLDVANDVDWHETHKMLKVALAAGVSPDSATYEIPYGTIGRSCNPRTKAERAKYEVPGQRWADLSDSAYGVSLLNDSKYGWDCHGNVLRLSLLRSPLSPDSLADRGMNHFRFALYPHAGDWRAAGTERLAAEYNTPLVASAAAPHGGALGRSVSFASVDTPGVELTWVKRAEDSDAWVLRLVEWFGRPATATVTLRPEIRSAHTSNFLEDPGEAVPATAHTLRVQLRPYEIATVVVEVR